MKVWLVLAFLELMACSSFDVPAEFKYKEIQTSSFKIATWQKITDNNAPFKIYIEGDGFAFRANGRISSNPTPRGTLVRELAFGDKHQNVIYLARPCQFVTDAICQPQDWSVARFSEKAVQAQYEAVKQITGNSSLTLVGFSGGAQIAGLMAVKYSDLKIDKLVTVAGNLDVIRWTEYHHLPPLNLSLDLHNYRNAYGKFNQVHYIGADDDNIVPEITRLFVINPHNLIIVEGADHNTGWEKVYERIRQE